MVYTAHCSHLPLECQGKSRPRKLCWQESGMQHPTLSLKGRKPELQSSFDQHLVETTVIGLAIRAYVFVKGLPMAVFNQRGDSTWCFWCSAMILTEASNTEYSLIISLGSVQVYAKALTLPDQSHGLVEPVTEENLISERLTCQKRLT